MDFVPRLKYFWCFQAIIMYEGWLCVCCMSTDDLVQLVASGAEDDGALNYAKLLAVCLHVPVSEVNRHDFICSECIIKLKDFISFKKQVLKSISILSSVDLNELLSTEERKLVELDTSKQNFLCSLQETESVTHKQQKEIQNPISVEVQLTSCLNEAIPNEDTQKVSVRRVGRPRKHAPSSLPYRVGKDELTCRECHLAFPNYFTLRVHYNSHFGRQECATCHKRFLTHASLKKHQLTHSTGPFYCGVCPQEFHNVNTLLSHRRRRHAPPRAPRSPHSPPAPRERRHACALCDRRFRTSGERAKHVRSRHDARRVPCAQCGARLRPASLRAHARTHARITTPKRFACRLCGGEFAQKKTLLYHVRAHARRRLYAGDARLLVADLAGARTHTGLLSDAESSGERCAGEDDYLLSIDQQHLEDRVHEICTSLAFSIPSDFDDS